MNTRRPSFSLNRGCNMWRSTSVALLFALEVCASAATHYVLKDNPGAEPPFTSWDTAAPDIQSAINEASPGALVLVGNGMYDSGTTVYEGTTNRIVVPDSVTVQSANGAVHTVLSGATGVRCAALLGSARLIGFSLTGADGSSAVWGEGGSAGVENTWIYGNQALRGGGAQGVSLVNCTLRENSASLQGGGAYDCSLQNCLLLGNSAENGGGSSASFLWNCTVMSNTASEFGGGTHDSVLRGCLVVGNVASQGGGCAGTESVLYSTTVSDNQASTTGGGVDGGLAFNSIIFSNRVATLPGDWTDATMSYSFSSPLPSGEENQTGDPFFIAPEQGNYRLRPESSCINAGSNQNWMSSTSDLDGTDRIVNEIVDLGAYEYNPPPVPDPQLILLGVDGFPIDNGAEPIISAGTDWVARSGQSAARTFLLTNAGNASVDFAGFSFSGIGADAFSVYSFPTSLDAGTSLSFSVVFHPEEARTYETTFQMAHSASNTPIPFDLNLRGTGVLPVHRYVAQGNPQATPPYTNWPTAAADIQSAIDLSLADDTIWVSNGVYASGAVDGLGEVLHRVAITNAVVVRSVNGPDTTFIQGDSGIRCAYLGVNASLIGFTLTNGLDAGGVWCADKTSVISNCVVIGNSASVGGGVLDGTLRNCVIVGNSADSGGGAFNARLVDCELTRNTAELGGGAYDSEIDRCLLSSNAATESGGGTYASIVNNSLLRGNTAAQGGGSFGGNLNTCTIVENVASVEGGGAYGSELLNCIVYYNDDNVASSTLSYCCVPQPLPGPGNIDAEPLFVDQAGGDFRVATNSPCINAGNNRAWMEGTLDLAGTLRVVGPSVDMGSYEYPLTPSGIEAQWLKDNSLPWDGTADNEDPDLDLFTNWQEWRANTDPHDATSLLALALPPSALPPDGVGWIVRWQSSTGKWYAIDRSTHLLGQPSFLPLADAQSIPGQFGFTTFTDRTSTASQPSFYRIRLP